jgi:hypothetical protein
MGVQIVWLLILSIPVACVAWTVTHEEAFRELRDFCTDRSQRCRTLVQRKFFFLFTCEYCFSHYIALLFLALTGYKLLMDNWVGYVIAFFALVFVSNAYMSLYARLRVDIRSERALADSQQKEAELREKELQRMSGSEPPDRRQDVPKQPD